LEKWIKFKKYGTHGKVQRSLKYRHTWKNAPQLEKCPTLGKMRHTWKSAALLKNTEVLDK